MNATMKFASESVFFGRLSAALEKRQIKTLTEFARKISVSPATAHAWKTTGALPQARTINQMAAFLGVSADWLRGKKDSEPNWVDSPSTSLRESRAIFGAAAESAIAGQRRLRISEDRENWRARADHTADALAGQLQALPFLESKSFADVESDVRALLDEYIDAARAAAQSKEGGS